MITYLPYPDFQRTAECLDDERLRTQCLDALQVLCVLQNLRWCPAQRRFVAGYDALHLRATPIVQMWCGWSGMLAFYGRIMLRERKRRTGRDVSLHRFEDGFGWLLVSGLVDTPPWLGDARLHASHRSVLLAKDPIHYGQFDWCDAPAKADNAGRWAYFWPNNEKVAKL